jgi:hypothetical protein
MCRDNKPFKGQYRTPEMGGVTTVVKQDFAIACPKPHNRPNQMPATNAVPN